MLKKFKRRTGQNVFYNLTTDESWIYSHNPLTMQESTQCVFEEDDKPTKVVRGWSVNKKIIAGFSRRSGPVAIIPLKGHKTVTSK